LFADGDAWHFGVKLGRVTEQAEAGQSQAALHELAAALG
jgi:hypothetical protein